MFYNGKMAKALYCSLDYDMRKINYFKRVIVSVDGDDEDLSAFIQSFGFAEEELSRVMDELNSFRTVPGTTIGGYMNRIISTIEKEDRSAFLKGILVGVVIRKAVDAMAEPDLTEEEKRIAREIEKLRFSEYIRCLRDKKS
jgi:hypothetical protein